LDFKLSLLDNNTANRWLIVADTLSVAHLNGFEIALIWTWKKGLRFHGTRFGQSQENI